MSGWSNTGGAKKSQGFAVVPNAKGEEQGCLGGFLVSGLGNWVKVRGMKQKQERFVGKNSEPHLGRSLEMSRWTCPEDSGMDLSVKLWRKFLIRNIDVGATRVFPMNV